MKLTILSLRLLILKFANTTNTTERFYSEQWSLLIQDIWKLLQIVVIIFGTFWAYSKFIKGRIYKPRLKCETNGELKKIGNTYYLKINILLENLGISKIPITQEGTGIYIYLYKIDKQSPDCYLQDTQWIEVNEIISIFENHHWIEANEPVEETKVIGVKLPPNCEDVTSFYIAIKIETQIVSRKRFYWYTQWNNTEIVWL